VWTSANRGREPEAPIAPQSGHCRSAVHIWEAPDGPICWFGAGFDRDARLLCLVRTRRVGVTLIIGREMVRTMMRRMCIEALYRRPNTPKARPGHKIYPYLLRGLAVERPNQVWCMDITYIPMAHGFVYLAAVVAGSATPRPKPLTSPHGMDDFEHPAQTPDQ
jgi:hypothetical protein